MLAFAIAESRVILTLNGRDFIHLHKAQPNHAGIIVCTYDADFMGQAQRIHAAIEAEPTLDGTLLRVNRPAK